MPEPAARQKQQLREQLRAARRTQLSDAGASAHEDRLANEDRLAKVLLAAPEVAGARQVAAYLSRAVEPGTGPLLRVLALRKVTVLLPVLCDDLDLDWSLDDASRSVGRFPSLPDLVEPAGPSLGVDAIRTADVVLVPALAVDRTGCRLGQGGGSYDRALARVPAQVPVIALLHPGELLEDRLPMQPHDRPVNAVATIDGLTWIRTPAPA